MKRLISIILMFALILTSCGNKVGSTPEEISESVEMKNLDLILDEAENRRHAEKAVMYTLINTK